MTISGEISNLRRPFSGHIYFSLKDEKSQIRGVMFKGQQRYLDEIPRDGQQVICRGRLSVYEVRGEYQIIVDFMNFHGTGSLQLAFEKLKKQLAAEGLFNKEHKKALPFLPERLCLITSPSSAAIHDFLKIAANRFPSIPIEIYPVRVQGDGAAEEIVQALKEVNRQQRAEVIILCRGGGSIEDLWPFNEEIVARSIFASSIPVVSAIGHEIDFTIADFIADQRAPTPTAAAEIVLPDQQMLSAKLTESKKTLARIMAMKLKNLQQRIMMECQLLGDPSHLLDHFRLVIDNSLAGAGYAMSRQLEKKKTKLNHLCKIFLELSPDRQIPSCRQKASAFHEQLQYTMRLSLKHQEGKLQQTVSRLEAMNPRNVLKRGYSIVRSKADAQIITNSNQAQRGDKLEILLHKGKIEAEVTKQIKIRPQRGRY